MKIHKAGNTHSSRFGVGEKLLVGYFVTLMATILCIGVGVLSFKKIHSYQQNLTDRTIPSMLDLYDITKHVAVVVDLSDSLEVILAPMAGTLITAFSGTAARKNDACSWTWSWETSRKASSANLSLSASSIKNASNG